MTYVQSIAETEASGDGQSHAYVAVGLGFGCAYDFLDHGSVTVVECHKSIHREKALAGCIE